MTVSISTDRRGVEIDWDTELVVGDTVEIKAVNTDNGDVSTRTAANDGKATVTYPNDYTGSSDITVTGSDSGTDTGTISV